MFRFRLLTFLLWMLFSIPNFSSLTFGQVRDGRGIVISSPIENVQVYVDGKNVGFAPFKGILSVDRHTIFAVTTNGLHSEIVHLTVNKGTGLMPELQMVFHDYVDLGLPSGTMWATFNVGASSPEEVGEYYAWTETQPVDENTSANYVYKTKMKNTDDVAYVKWGPSWQMPSLRDFNELVDKHYTSCVFTTQNDVKGLLVKSLKNGNSIFLPAGGFNYDGKVNDVNVVGNYWTSTAGDAFLNGSYQFCFYEDDFIEHYCDRFLGRSVRPVWKCRE